MRYESPVMTTSRVATEDMELRGQQIKAGDNINLMIASANRDPDQFPDPDTYVIDRRPNRHLTFAHGAHFCLGSALARNVSQIAVLSALSVPEHAAFPTRSSGLRVSLSGTRRRCR